MQNVCDTKKLYTIAYFKLESLVVTTLLRRRCCYADADVDKLAMFSLVGRLTCFQDNS